MKSITLTICTLILAGGFVACSSPAGPEVKQIETGIDAMAAAVTAAGTDCKKMAQGIKAPTMQVATAMKALKAKKTKPPASLMLKMGSLRSTFEKIAPCQKEPEMQKTMASFQQIFMQQ